MSGVEDLCVESTFEMLCCPFLVLIFLSRGLWLSIPCLWLCKLHATLLYHITHLLRWTQHKLTYRNISESWCHPQYLSLQCRYFVNVLLSEVNRTMFFLQDTAIVKRQSMVIIGQVQVYKRTIKCHHLCQGYKKITLCAVELTFSSNDPWTCNFQVCTWQSVDIWSGFRWKPKYWGDHIKTSKHCPSG